MLDYSRDSIAPQDSPQAMSAIVGLYYLNEQPVNQAELAAMSHRLAAHGADQAGCWRQGAVGLAQRQMVITPEDCAEQQPLTSADGKLVLVSDARLDNRPELLDALRLSSSEAATLPDSALILRACVHWGHDAPKHLLGDYAFALWDEERRQLLLARSPLGNRPLYYIHTPACFAFATMPGGLFALPWVPRVLALEKLLDPAPSRTLYRDLQKMPAGHWLIVRPSGLQQRAFWQLDLERRLHFRRDEEYVEAFDELFTRAVDRQLRSRHPIGVMMSGGLDSSAVAVTAARLLAAHGQRVSAFTEVPRTGFAGPLPAGKYADETPLVQAIAARYSNLDLNLVHTDGQGPFDDLDHFFATMYGPFQNVSNRIWFEAIHAQAQAQGIRVLLSGASGNLTVSWHGDNPFPTWLWHGAWGTAWRAAQAQSNTPLGAGRVLLSQGLLPWLPSKFQATLYHWRTRRNPLLIPTPLHPRLLAAHHRAQWLHHQFPIAGAERQWRAAALQSPHAGDYEAAYEARFGISQRDPTSYLPLVEFCFAVPEAQWRRGRERRALIRRAMADRLPAAVLHNPQRGMQAADWYERVLAQRQAIAADLACLQHNATAQRYLNLPYMRQLAATLTTAGWEQPERFAQVQWGLLGGLMLGRFILWFETMAAQEEPLAPAWTPAGAQPTINKEQ